MRPPIDLIEFGSPEKVVLSVSEYEALSQLGIAKVTQTPSGQYSIKPGSKVGSVTYRDIQINVRPKITELNRLLFFVGYCSNPAIWREEFVHLDQAPGLYPAVAESFSRLASRAIEGGLLQGYHTRSDSLAVVRGRVQFREQIMRNYGLPLPIAVEYDDFTTDIIENQIVLLATLRLLSIPDIGVGARQQLSRLRWLLDEITMLPNRGRAPKCQLDRINARYHDLLRLSEVILDNSSFDQNNGSLAVSGFMFDMWRIYEDFVTGAVGMAMRQFGGHPRVQFGRHLDKASRIKFIPDLVWCDDNDVPVAVVDAKYKAERPKGFPEADLYQMLAYCAVLDLPEGHLIYAKGNEPATIHEIRNCGITIHCHALDLSQPPKQLLAEIDSLARAILHR
ncbi:McrC family protein [Nocardia suismassiliense]|uniref:McrC family protein n=1 Tax=Nocardia suismassiliense TaxID=2077092 RepID=UPI000D1F9FFC|nr:restriction endonuclease [Nocardia suismassiliense]